MLCVLCIFHKVCNSAGFWKKAEHFLIVCGVAEINNTFFGVFDAIMLFEIEKAHGKFVVISEPGVDVDEPLLLPQK